MKMKSALSITACAVALSAAAFSAAYAQDQQTKEVEDVVIVTGIRASVQEALDTKRDATGFVDAVNATDVGKLPDNNIAEALQRISGVAIQRSRGEGDFVSIRGLGPDFVRGTVNGRSLVSATESIDATLSGNTITTTGRAANFDVLPSELIASLEVFKTPSAKHVEGGIGGVVNTITARPLDIGHRYTASVEGTYRQFGEELDPKASGLVSWVNEAGDFGALFSAAYSERTIRQDFERTFGFFNSFGISQQLDTDGDGVGDASPADVLFPLSNNNESLLENRDRLTFSGTLQWQPDSDTNIVFDALYSRREIDSTAQNLIFLPITFDADLLALGLDNPDGSFDVSGLVENGTFNVLPSTLRPELTTDNQSGDDELLSFGLYAERQIGAWNLSMDVNYSDASGGTTFDRVRIDGDGGNFSFVTEVDEDGFTIAEQAGSTDIGDPASYFLSVLDDRVTSNDDKEFAVQFDAKREIDSNFLSSVEFGGRFRTREKDVSRQTNGNGVGVIGEGISLADVGTFNQGASDFLDGDFQSSFAFSDLVFSDNDASRAALEAVGVFAPPPLDPSGVSSIEEDTYAVYAQLNLGGEIGSVGFLGDVGVRLVHTRQDVSGFGAVYTFIDNGGTDTTVFDALEIGEPTPIDFQEEYTIALPSLNLRFELFDDFFLRFAASKSLTRPTFNELAPSFNFNANASNDVNQDGFAIQLTAGNPALAPYESSNLDFGLEWYPMTSTVLGFNVFYKAVDSFIAGATDGPSTTLAGEPIGAVGQLLGGGVIDPLPIDQITQPDNQGEAEIAGIELNWQQSLPYGFGLLANLTLTDTNAEFLSTGETIDFPGVSDVAYNITGYYENHGFQARLAWSYRDEFLLIPSAAGGAPQQIFVDGFGQLDASISYDVTDNFQVYANAINLTDEEEKLFTTIAGIGDRFNSRSIVGRRFGFGVRASF